MFEFNITIQFENIKKNIMLKAIIFDFDGVIADAEPMHFKAFQQVLNLEGINLTENDYYDKYLALDDKTLFGSILKENKLNFSGSILESYMRKKSDAYKQLMKNDIKVFPGVVDFVSDVSEKFVLAIGSGALRSEIEYILDKIGMKNKFEAIVSAEDVEKCKPDPEVFIKALENINHEITTYQHKINPRECLVIEDSIAGVMAAKAADMRSLAITNSYPFDKLYEADLVYDSLKDVNIEDIEKLFKAQE